MIGMFEIKGFCFKTPHCVVLYWIKQNVASGC